MKTFKFFILACVIACFSVGTAISQVQRWVNTETYHESSIWFGCIDEPLTGDIEYTYTVAWMEGINWLKWQERYKGTLIGDYTGEIYTISQVANDHQVQVSQAGNWYYVTTFTIEKDGQPVLTFHRLVHGTANDATWNKKEGNWAAYVDNEWFECY